jgi:hypothetical protein
MRHLRHIVAERPLAEVTEEVTTPAPMVLMRFFRDWPFSGANLTSLLLFFGLFGSVFLLAQFFHIVQGYPLARRAAT